MERVQVADSHSSADNRKPRGNSLFPALRRMFAMRRFEPSAGDVRGRLLPKHTLLHLNALADRSKRLGRRIRNLYQAAARGDA